MSVNNLRPTERFSDRVKDYVKFRPSYPSELFDYLEKTCGVKGKRIADVGSGTGISTRLLLERGAIVDAVEPNQKMREAAETEFTGIANFHSHNGTAEATTLPDRSIDLITCAQAFHWFDPVATRMEFDRILKSGGKTALIWNDVDQEDDFGAAYEKFKTTYSDLSLQNVRDIEAKLDETLPQFFKTFEEKIFRNYQELDVEGLLGRYFSSSYAPREGDPKKEKIAQSLRDLFTRFQSNGVVRLSYRTELYLG